jgi:hypothetical protein
MPEIKTIAAQTLKLLQPYGIQTYLVSGGAGPG